MEIETTTKIASTLKSLSGILNSISSINSFSSKDVWQLADLQDLLFVHCPPPLESGVCPPNFFILNFPIQFSKSDEVFPFIVIFSATPKLDSRSGKTYSQQNPSCSCRHFQSSASYELSLKKPDSLLKKTATRKCLKN